MCERERTRTCARVRDNRRGEESLARACVRMKCFFRSEHRRPNGCCSRRRFVVDILACTQEDEKGRRIESNGRMGRGGGKR